MNPFQNMTKAYDFEAFVAELKKQGLVVTEDVAKALFKTSMAFMKKSAELSPTPVDNIVVSVLEQFIPVAEVAIDGIDGEVG